MPQLTRASRRFLLTHASQTACSQGNTTGGEAGFSEKLGELEADGDALVRSVEQPRQRSMKRELRRRESCEERLELEVGV